MSATPISFSLREIAERFGGEVVGDPDLRVTRVGTLENAGPGSIAFLANARYMHQVETTRAAAVILAPEARDATDTARIVCSNPYAYFARISALLNPGRKLTAGVHPSAVVHSSASVHPDAEVAAHAVIDECAHVGSGSYIGPAAYLGPHARVGCASRLNARVTVHEGCVVGDRVIIHSGVVIGADGFGIAYDEERWVKVPQVGRVRIGDDVEIGANTTIDRGAIDDTVIEEGVKLDNQIQIAHNVRIGAHTAIAACTGIAGSVTVGRHCRIGGAVGITGHVHIADRVEISGHTAITRSIETPGVYTGVYPFEVNREWRRNAAQVRHLSEMGQRLKKIESTLHELARRLGTQG